MGDKMNDEQREAQIRYGNMTGIHNMSPAICNDCGKLVTVGLKQKCPHEQTNQNYAVYPLGTGDV